MQIPRPAGDTAWKCTGFRAPMAAIRSGKAGFFGGIYSHVHRPEGRAPAGPAARCTCVYRAIEAGMPVPRPAWWPCARFSGRLRRQFRAVKRVFWGGHLLACTPAGSASPSWPSGPMYMRVHGDRGRNAGSKACRRYGMEMRRILWPPTAAIGSGKAGFFVGHLLACTPAGSASPAGAGARCTRV
jgi:hypothetical protein